MQGATFPPPPNQPGHAADGSSSSSRAGLTNAGVGVAKTVAKGSIKKFFASPLMWLRFGGRGVQLVFALVVCGFYGSRVGGDHADGRAQAPAWCYALFVGAASAVAAAALAVPFWKTHKLFAADALLSLLWVVVFGTFAAKFLHISDEDKARYDADGDHVSVGAMKTAVWLDLLNAVFWLLTAVYGFVYGRAVEKGKGFGRFFASKATGKLGDLEAGARDRVDDRFGPAFQSFDEKVNANPIAAGVSSKVGAAIKSKAAAQVAARVGRVV
ncbi:hypothetical protein SLS62_008182 [Diatrype stigma]|uniref:MARVEL domain-containing protein n=1 Tax=Diatrype stigma TaxID=117547 RepID=A0AAN9YM44_9PEZI